MLSLFILASIAPFVGKVVGSRFKPWHGENLGGVLVAGGGARTPTEPPNAHINGCPCLHV